MPVFERGVPSAKKEDDATDGCLSVSDWYWYCLLIIRRVGDALI